MNNTEPTAGPAVRDSLTGHPLTARLSRAGQRARQWDGRHRWVLDAAVVVVLFVLFCLPDLTHAEGRPDARIEFARLTTPEMLLFQVGLLVPLYFRRRAPMVAFHAVAVVFLIQWSLDTVLRADIALLVALYSLVLHGRLGRLWWAIPALVAALGLVAQRISDMVSIWDALIFLSVGATAAAALGFAVRIRRAQVAALRERAVQLEIERDQRSQLAAATERTRVAREMHDIVGHSLSVIITLADGGSYATSVSPERGKEALDRIGDTGRQALAELRRVLGVLRERNDRKRDDSDYNPTEHNGAPELNPQPGIRDIDTLCDRIRAAGPRVEYHTAGDVDGLDIGVQLTAYRIVQEALTNTLKHAGTQTRVQLTLRVDGDALQILIRDSGPINDSGPIPGTDRPAGRADEGHGMIGMRERAALYNGTVAAGPRTGGGWTTTVTLDLTPLPETTTSPTTVDRIPTAVPPGADGGAR